MRKLARIRPPGVLVLLPLLASLTGGYEAHGETQLSRATFRCTRLAEVLACAEALNIKRNDPDLLVAEADALVQSKRPGEAIGVYRNAMTVAAKPDVVNPKIAAAQSLRRSLIDICTEREGEVAERACASAWLPGAPDEVMLFKRRGLLLQASGQHAAALDAYMAAARLKPHDRGVASAIVKLSGRSPQDATVLTALGSAQLALGHPAEALDALRQAVHLAPDLAVAKERLRTAERAVTANAQLAAQNIDHSSEVPAVGTDAAPVSYSNEAEATRSN